MSATGIAYEDLEGLGHTRLDRSAAAGDVIIQVRAVPERIVGELLLVDGEVRQVTAWDGGRRLTLASALSAGHEAGARVYRPGSEGLNVRWFGAKGDGVTNDAAAIQAAITAAPSGGHVFIPAGRYKIGTALTLKSNLRISGEGGGKHVVAGGQVGTTLVWSGAVSSSMLVLASVQHVVVEGLVLDGADTSGSVGIRITSDNNPTTTLLHFDNFSVLRCDTGVYIGDGTVNNTNHLEFTRFLVYECNVYGFRVNGYNSDSCRLADGAISAPTCIYAEVWSYVTLERVNGYSGDGAACTFFHLVQGSCTLIECQAEDADGGYFFVVDAAAPASQNAVVFIHCTVDLPVEIRKMKSFISLGSRWQANLVISGDDAIAQLFGDDFVTSLATVSVTGTNAKLWRVGGYLRDLDGDYASGMQFGGERIKRVITYSTTWDPGSLANGASESKSVYMGTSKLIAPGNPVQVGFNFMVSATPESGNWQISARILQTGWVTVTITNLTGNTKDLDSATLNILVFEI